MESQVPKEKLNTEVKWGSYYFIYTLFLSYLILFFVVFQLSYYNIASFIALVLNLILFVYFSIQCIREQQTQGNVTFAAKVLIALRIFTLNYIFMTLMHINTDVFIIPRRELEIVETEEPLDEHNSNLIFDFFDFIRNKIKN
jgi:Ca2+/Na+ antiporter